MNRRNQGLIGPAGSILRELIKKLGHIREREKLKLLLHGSPGVGKTEIANTLAHQLAAEGVDIESINGRDLTIDVVRIWKQNSCYGSLFGEWKIKIVNELDLAPQVAQDLMLTYLDELPPQQGVIATSNASAETLTERFATRFISVEVSPPDSDEITRHLMRRFHLGKQAAAMIAVASCGNVRSAELQAQGFDLVGEAAKRAPRPAVHVVCPARSDAARRAIETQRRNREQKGAA
jgi:replication-associated recombination protein RarA